MELPVHGARGVVLAWAQVDQADYDRLSCFHWRFQTSNGGRVRYVCRFEYVGNYKHVCTYLHREVLGLERGDKRVADHINHDTLDNRRANLRAVTRGENQQNRRGTTTRSASGRRGVTWNAERQRWVAQANLNGKHFTLGYFATPEEAASAAAQWRREHMPFSSEVAA